MLRKLAKDPVMVYIYGASITSIRKKLAHSIGKAKLIDSIKELNKTKGEIKPDNKHMKYISSVLDLTDMSQYKYIKYDEDGTPKHYTSEYKGKSSVQKMIDDGITTKREQLMYLEFDDNIMSTLEDAVNMTFGDAFEASFDENFGEVNKARDLVKNIEMISFEGFKSRLDKKMNEFKSSNNGILTQEALTSIINEMNEIGFGHNSPTGEPDSKNVQPLMSIETKGSGKQASIVLTFNERPGTDSHVKWLQDRLNMTLDGFNVVANTGAAPTITIHAIDGELISRAIADNAWLSIYDAIVQAADPQTMIDSTESMNYETIESSLNRNITRDNLKKANYMYANLSDEEKESIRTRMKRVTKHELSDIKTVTLSKEAIDKRPDIKSLRSGKDKADGKSKYMVVKPKNVTIKMRTIKTDDRTTTMMNYIKEVKGINTIYKTKVIVENNDNTKTITEIYRSDVNVGKNTNKEYRPQFKRVYTIPTNQKEDHINKHVEWKDSGIVIENNGKKTTIDSVLDEKATSRLAPSQAGSDFKNDLKRLFQSLETMVTNIENANPQMKKRFENEMQEFMSTNAWIFGGKHAIHKGRDSKEVYENIEIKEISKFLKDSIKEFIENEYKYIDQEMKVIIEAEKVANKKSYKQKDFNKMSIAYSLAKKTGGGVEFIGQGHKKSSTRQYKEMFESIGRANTGAYTDKSVIVVSVNGKNDNRIRIKNEFDEIAGVYKNIDKAIKAGSIIIADTETSISKSKYNIGEEELAIYMESKGYIRTNRKEAGVWQHKSDMRGKTKPKTQNQIDNKTETHEVSSYSEGLEYALTNPTHTTPTGFKFGLKQRKNKNGKLIPWTKGQLETRKWLGKRKIKFNNKEYLDVEQAYQQNKGNMNSNQKYNLMVKLIDIKLKTYPELVEKVNVKGGIEYLNNITHNPTGNVNSLWETAGQDWFKKALIEAYKNVTKTQNQTNNDIISQEIMDKARNSDKFIKANEIKKDLDNKC